MTDGSQAEVQLYKKELFLTGKHYSQKSRDFGCLPVVKQTLHFALLYSTL